PKDGPSAGLAMVTAIVSALTGIPVRHDIAMTGEVSLRGRAMQIGGLKEKLLAALRGGIKTVFLPRENVKDLVEMPQNIKEGLELVPVDTVDEVLAKALIRNPFGGKKGGAKKVAATVVEPRKSPKGPAPLHARHQSRLN